MISEDEFQAALDLNIDDHVTRGVFGDWLCERDDPRGPGYQCLSRLGLCPCPEMDHADLCAWYGNASLMMTSLERYALPGDWFAAIVLFGKSVVYAPDHDLRTTCPRRELDDAVALAFSKLPPDRRAELFASEPERRPRNN